jgi:hypothetical protein
MATPMPNAAFLRDQAERCRRLAAACTEVGIIGQLEEMAAEYHSRAAALGPTDQTSSQDPSAVGDVRELYTSPNGDVWYLIRDRQTRRVFVRHRANIHSGGRVTDTDIDVFLKLSGEPPEKQALLKLNGAYFED